MENLHNRFPTLISKILENVDAESLVTFKSTNRQMHGFIVEERFYWIRIIKKYNEDWEQIINKTPIEALKELAVESERSYWIKVIRSHDERFEGFQDFWN